MKIKIRQMTKQMASPAVLFIILGAVALAFVSGWGVARGSAGARSAAGETSIDSPTPTVNVAPAQPDAQVLTLGQSGFEPSQITRTAGSFSFRVDNQSGTDSLSMRLTREGTGQVLEYTTPPGAADYVHQINLQAGQYTLTETNHPSWVCNITVQ